MLMLKLFDNIQLEEMNLLLSGFVATQFLNTNTSTVTCGSHRHMD
jgi:hypothetical protein